MILGLLGTMEFLLEVCSAMLKTEGKKKKGFRRHQKGAEGGGDTKIKRTKMPKKEERWGREAKKIDPKKLKWVLYHIGWKNQYPFLIKK